MKSPPKSDFAQGALLVIGALIANTLFQRNRIASIRLQGTKGQ